MRARDVPQAIGRLPTSQLRSTLAIVLSTLVVVTYLSVALTGGSWTPANEVLMFVAWLDGSAVTQYYLKRKTHIPGAGQSDGA